MAYLLKRRISALPIPREKGRMTNPKKEMVMTMVIFFHT